MRSSCLEADGEAACSEVLRAHLWPGMMNWDQCIPAGSHAGCSVPAGRDMGCGVGAVQGCTGRWNGNPAILGKKTCPEEVGWGCGVAGRGLASHAQSLAFEPHKN